MNGNERIDSLQILRTIACLGVFGFHSGLIVSGHWGVSIFIMLSGFLLYYKNSERNIDSSIENSFRFSIKRIVKLYPLHIVTMIIIMILKYRSIIKTIEDATKGVPVFVGQVLSNVFLVKSWIPKDEYCFSFNSVSWYLSTALFLYLVFPKLLLFYKKNITTVKKAFISTVIVILGEVILSYAAFLVDAHLMSGDGDFTAWFAYVFPIMRVIDLFIGMNLAYIFMHMKVPKKLTVIIFEIVAVVSIIFIEYIHRISQGSANTNWFKYNLICIIPVMLLIYSFATNKGVVEKVLSNKFVLFVGEMSAFFFLIQEIAIWTVRYFAAKTSNNYFNIPIQAICAFILALIMSFAWSRIERKVKGIVHNLK